MLSKKIGRNTIPRCINRGDAVAEALIKYSIQKEVDWCDFRILNSSTKFYRLSRTRGGNACGNQGRLCTVKRWGVRHRADAGLGEPTTFVKMPFRWGSTGGDYGPKSRSMDRTGEIGDRTSGAENNLL